MKKKHCIYVNNLNTSLVFYRALFDVMPSEITVDRLLFETGEFQLQVVEKGQPTVPPAPLRYPVDPIELASIHSRMKRFTGRQRLMESCEE